MTDIVQANEGFFVIEHHENYAEKIMLYPVVAWAFVDWNPRPITVKHGAIFTNTAVQHPNGLVIETDRKDRVWTCVDAWLESKSSQ